MGHITIHMEWNYKLVSEQHGCPAARTGRQCPAIVPIYTHWYYFIEPKGKEI
ncbi:MAG: hypothetical protein ABIL06_22545 [Pseudomonadota bacterium]